jgi:predicted HicB family RNase H-like nuclease
MAKKKKKATKRAPAKKTAKKKAKRAPAKAKAKKRTVRPSTNYSEAFQLRIGKRAEATLNKMAKKSGLKRAIHLRIALDRGLGIK